MATVIQRKIWVALVGVALCAAIMVIAVPGKASADTELGHSGYIGPHGLYDNPGAICINEDYARATIWVRSPRMWANRAYTRGQRVGYRAELIYNSGNGGQWANHTTTRLFTATAYPNSRASFAEWINISFPHAYPKYFRVAIHMFWFDNSGRVQGRSVHMVDSYQTGYYQNGQLRSNERQWDSCRV